MPRFLVLLLVLAAFELPAHFLAFPGFEFPALESSSAAERQDDFVISELHIRTKNGLLTGMTYGWIDVQVITGAFGICQIQTLLGSDNGFQAGQVNTYNGSELEECLRFPVPDKLVARVRLTLHGLENWTPDWVRVVFDDDSFSQCDDGTAMSPGEEHDLECFLDDEAE